MPDGLREGFRQKHAFVWTLRAWKNTTEGLGDTGRKAGTECALEERKSLCEEAQGTWRTGGVASSEMLSAQDKSLENKEGLEKLVEN